jgi:hypothetical protein
MRKVVNMGKVRASLERCDEHSAKEKRRLSTQERKDVPAEAVGKLFLTQRTQRLLPRKAEAVLLCGLCKNLGVLCV